MDVTSYLLGKQSSGGGGGGGSDLDWSVIGYSGAPQSIVEGYNYAVEIMNNWDNTQTDLSNKFANDTALFVMPLVDTSNATSTFQMFYQCEYLSDLPLLNISESTNMSGMFYGCKKLKTIPKIDTSSVTNIKNIFNGCTRLENIPLLNTSNISGNSSFQSIVSGCPNLTNTSLDNILQMCINATKYNGIKTLARLGFSVNDYSVEKIQSLPHYQDFINAGWTIGY